MSLRWLGPGPAVAFGIQPEVGVVADALGRSLEGVMVRIPIGAEKKYLTNHKARLERELLTAVPAGTS